MAGDEERPSDPADAVGRDPERREPDPVPRLDTEVAADELAVAEQAAGRPAEAAAVAAEPAPARRSLMPALLAGIGGVLIVLLAANLYGLYNPPANAAIPALQADVSRLSHEVDALAKQPPVDLGPLDARVSALDDRLSGLKSAVERDAGGAAVAREAKAAVQPLAAEVNDLHGALEALAGRVAALPKVDLAPLNSRLDAIDARMKPLEAYFAAPKAGERVTETRQNGSAAETRAAPVAVIADGVIDALRAGRPFASEVAALAGLGIDKAALAPLEAVAGAGAATNAELASGFGSVEDATVVAAAPVSTGTLMDRMMANAQSLVKVSRTGAGPGEDAGAVASRIAAALKAGDLTGAEADWEKLPDASRSRSSDWAGRLKARVAADAAASAIRRSAVEALAATVPAP